MNWKKITTGFAAMMLGTALTFGTVTEAAKSSPTIRYFMQQPGVQGSATPYGNNEKAGHYVQAGDAKIYYEVYGKGKPLFVFKAWHSAFNDNFPVTWAAMQSFLQADRSKLTGSKKVAYNNRR